MKTIGSQNRETLKESGLILSVLQGTYPTQEAILVNPETKEKELWIENDHFAGYVIEIKSTGFEYVRDI